jgi:hypothetical protein
VDEDTRFLLDHIKAATKCGVGSRARHPYLDIILPPQFERRESDDHWLLIDPDRFESKMPRRMPLFHENDFSVTNTHLVYGPYIQLPEGRFRAHFGLRLRAPFPRFPGVKIVLDVARKTETIAARQILWRHSGEPRAASIEFTNNEAGAKHEFRIHARGRPVLTRLRFSGVRLEQTDGSQARLKPAELHIGEQLSLLVDLICQRIHNFHPTFPFAQGSGSFDLTMSRMGPSTKTIVVAPISHSSIRDWGIPNYARLIELLLQKLPCCVVLVGSNSQRDQLNLITAENGRDRRVINLAGRSNWSQTAAIVRDADLVISNNSGIGHLAAACATPTLSIFSGSHQPQEWGPRGNGVLVMMASVPCSPCGHHRIEFCPNDHLCMKQIVPETVAEQAIAILNSDFVRLREQYRDGQVFERH